MVYLIVSPVLLLQTILARVREYCLREALLTPGAPLHELHLAAAVSPFWHGSLKQLEDNMNDIAVRYGKDLIIAEVSMGFTMDDYKDYEKLSDSERKGYATKPELVAKIEYPMTIEGQKAFYRGFLKSRGKSAR